MYYYISGKLIKTDASSAVIDNNGIAYILNASVNSLRKISSKDECKLYTYLSVREDAQELFGFADEEELAVFKLLINISGVGPKAALAILSVLTPDSLASAVTAGDVKAISAAQGVGKKIAERVVLELKDKLNPYTSSNDVQLSSPGEIAAPSDKKAEAINALVLLGYSRSEAIHALSNVDVNGLEIEDIIRSALKNLF